MPGAKILAKDVSPFLAGHGSILGYPDAVIDRVNDHHGVVTLPGGGPRPPIGTVVWVMPNHVCPVVNLVDEVVVASGGRIVDRWPVDARGATADARQRSVRGQVVLDAGGVQDRATRSERDRPDAQDLRQLAPVQSMTVEAGPPCAGPAVEDEVDGVAELRRRSRPRRAPPGSPDTLAEVVGSGPTPRASARGASWSGTRRPMVGAPPVRAAGSVDVRPARHDHGQTAGPAGVGERRRGRPHARRSSPPGRRRRGAA